MRQAPRESMGFVVVSMVGRMSELAPPLELEDILAANRRLVTRPGKTHYDDYALSVNVQMLDDGLQARYREIYGYDWEEIPPVVDGDEPDPRLAAGSVEMSVTAITVVGRPGGRR